MRNLVVRTIRTRELPLSFLNCTCCILTWSYKNGSFWFCTQIFLAFVINMRTVKFFFANDWNSPSSKTQLWLKFGSASTSQDCSKFAQILKIAQSLVDGSQGRGDLKSTKAWRLTTQHFVDFHKSVALCEAKFWRIFTRAWRFAPVMPHENWLQ